MVGGIDASDCRVTSRDSGTPRTPATPIRDETLRDGLVRMGAVKEREGLPTTSPRPRYALAEEFARLFDSGLTGEALQAGIEEWQRVNLSTGATGTGGDHAPRCGCTRGKGARDVPERGKPGRWSRDQVP